MFRCLRPGCPTGCGTRSRPSCRDKSLSLALMLLLALVLFASLRAGVKSLDSGASNSGVVAEPVPVPASQVAELASQAEDNRRQGGLGDADGQSELFTDVPVQVPKER